MATYQYGKKNSIQMQKWVKNKASGPGVLGLPSQKFPPFPPFYFSKSTSKQKNRIHVDLDPKQ
jgi:hypothetical protein